MKKITSILVSMAMIAAMFVLPVYAAAGDYAGGTGSADDPYQISNATQLAQASTDANASGGGGLCFKLTADINYQNAEWTPIGSAVAYTGTFDGDGHKVSNLKVTTNYSSSAGVGFFGKAEQAKIKNLGVENINLLTTESSYQGGFGGMVGFSWTATFTNCYVKSSSVVYSNSNRMAYVGGFVGRVGGGSKFENCYVYNTKICGRGNEANGGFVGIDNNGTNKYTNCYTAKVTAVPSLSVDFPKRARTMYGFGCMSGTTPTVTNCYSTVASIKGDTGTPECDSANDMASAYTGMTTEAFLDAVVATGAYATNSTINDGFPYLISKTIVA